MSYTLTPWASEEVPFDKKRRVFIASTNPNVQLRCVVEAGSVKPEDAARIVRCVNAHDALVSALEEIARPLSPSEGKQAAEAIARNALAALASS